MKLKGIAAFSIILMALIVAPQAANDLREFLGSIAESAHSAFLHAVIESRTGVTSGPEKAVSSSEHSTVCLNRAPSEVNPRMRVRRPLRPNNDSSHVKNLSLKVPASDGSRIEVAAFYPERIKSINLDGLTAMDTVQLDTLAKGIKKTVVVTEDQRKLENSECVRRLIKAAMMEKNRSTRQPQRATFPAFKANIKLLKPPAVALSPMAEVNEIKVDSISGTPEDVETSE